MGKKEFKEYETTSEEETFLLARQLAKRFKGKEIVLLIGALGAGKTVFVKGLAAGLGLRDIDKVCSPSYALVNIYHGKFPIFHIDLYRLDKKIEIEELGWEDYMGQGVIIIEWAEKVRFDWDVIQVKIEISNSNKRKIKIHF